MQFLKEFGIAIKLDRSIKMWLKEPIMKYI